MAGKKLDVVIVGGSLTGLLHGVVLKRLGHNVRILERSTSLNDQGAGILAREHLQNFFSKHDLCNLPFYVQADPRIQFLNKEAEIIKVWKAQLRMTSWDNVYYRLRANFDGFESDYVKERPLEDKSRNGNVSYEYGCTVTDLKYSDGLVTLTFERSGGGGGTLHADLVIAADGAGSSIRRMLYPNVERKYVGYAAWRGTTVESEMSDQAKTRLTTCCNYFNHKDGHMLLYTIPGKNGSLQPGERLLNFVWYCNYAEDSPEYVDLLTDTDGHKHRITIPMGKMRPEVWSAQKDYAKSLLPAPFSEVVVKTRQPFVQCITDVSAPKAVHFEGKLLLTGDALCSFRPHVGASTNQAALNALQLERVMKGEITLVEWENVCLQYAELTSLTGVTLGRWNQYGLWKTLSSAFWLAKAYLVIPKLSISPEEQLSSKRCQTSAKDPLSFQTIQQHHLVMSFGFAVGDVITILNLFERVALEIRSYRSAPEHFQQLGTELQLLQRSLHRLLQVEPSDEDEARELDQIRAIAIHCHQPIQAFISKMRPSDKSLGHVRSSTTLSAIGKRLHWSLITKQDVDGLRKVIMSEMIAINMLLGMQQLASLRRLKISTNNTMQSELKQFCAQSQDFFSSSATVFRNLELLPANLASLRDSMAEQTLKDSKTAEKVIGGLDAISIESKTLIRQSQSTATRLDNLRNQVSRSIIALISIVRDIKEILISLQAFSKDLSKMIIANGKTFLDIHQMMKRLVRAVEAIPLHLSLPIVRLDDALGESWALPYQACQTLEVFYHPQISLSDAADLQWAFEQILRQVVIANGRPGARGVNTGQFFIRAVENGMPLDNVTWKHAVKERAHLTQTMIVADANKIAFECPFPDCSGTLPLNGNCCSVCGPLPAFVKRALRNKSDFSNFTSILARYVNVDPEEIKFFRNIHFVENKIVIQRIGQKLDNHVEHWRVTTDDDCEVLKLRLSGQQWYLIDEDSDSEFDSDSDDFEFDFDIDGV